MARKHTKLGYSHHDVIDYRTWNEAAFARRSRRQAIFTHLDAAADYRRWSQNPREFYTREDHLRHAVNYLRKAREWRLEIGG
jgi:hypothetical protein